MITVKINDEVKVQVPEDMMRYIRRFADREGITLSKAFSTLLNVNRHQMSQYPDGPPDMFSSNQEDPDDFVFGKGYLRTA